jgi:hypothetical protein
LSAADEPGRDHLGVVDDHDVAGVGKPQQVSDAKVPELPADGQKARRTAASLLKKGMFPAVSDARKAA